MIRSRHAASLARSNLRCLATPPARTATSLAWANGSKPNALRVPVAKKHCDLALAICRPFSTSVQRYQSGGASPYDQIDKKHELALEREKLEVHPDEVSTASSVHGVFSEKGVEEPEKSEDMLAGVKEDLVGFLTDRDRRMLTADAIDERKRSRIHSLSMKCPARP